jgi:hypothetical protein
LLFASLPTLTSAKPLESVLYVLIPSPELENATSSFNAGLVVPIPTLPPLALSFKKLVEAPLYA